MKCKGTTTVITSCQSNSSGCPCPKGGNTELSSLKKVVNCYVTRFRGGACPRPSAEENYYSSQSSLVEALGAAGMAEVDKNKRHPHQYRLSKPSLKSWKKALLEHQGEIDNCSSFNELHLLLHDLRPKGIGRLTIYDTAMRIGYFKKLYPKEVYLHAGTAEGASAFRTWNGRATVSVEDLPHEIRILEPHQIEDFLCVCKNQLHWLKSQGRL